MKFVGKGEAAKVVGSVDRTANHKGMLDFDGSNELTVKLTDKDVDVLAVTMMLMIVEEITDDIFARRDVDKKVDLVDLGALMLFD